MTEAPAWMTPERVGEVFRQRADRLLKLRADPMLMAKVRSYYRDHPADFIHDWGCTFDPRNIEQGLPAVVPFLLFTKQREWVDWLVERWRTQQDGVTEKSRDVGASWLAVSLGATLAIHHQGFVAGFGSRKEALVDNSSDPDALFWKARRFIALLPREFRGGYEPKSCSAHMRLLFPDTGSVLKGEAGDNIGRGGRSSIYFTDEDAFIPRGKIVDAALSQNTNCRQRVSSVNGMQNPFAEQRHAGKVPVFTMHWRDDPRKDDAWYQKQVERLDPLIVAQEIDLSYTASIEGVVIPSAWVSAAVEAFALLPDARSGMRRGGLDVADEGRDKNAYASRHGVALIGLQDWSGEGSDIYATVERAFGIARLNGEEGFDYDADGLGAGVRGDAKRINAAGGAAVLDVQPFWGSGGVLDPEGRIPSPEVTPGRDTLERTNADYFANFKAQAWWSTRTRFLRTARAVAAMKKGEPCPYPVDQLIVIDPALPLLGRLQSELSQVQYRPSGAGKILIDKAPEGMKSPNLADAVVIAFAPRAPRRRGFVGAFGGA